MVRGSLPRYRFAAGLVADCSSPDALVGAPGTVTPFGEPPRAAGAGAAVSSGSGLADRAPGDSLDEGQARDRLSARPTHSQSPR